MLRFGFIVLLALAVPLSPLHAGAARKAPKKQERSIERFVDGTDAERKAMLKNTLKTLAALGYRDVLLVPWFVMMAKNERGREVLLLVDPVSMQTMEIEREDDEVAAASER